MNRQMRSFPIPEGLEGMRADAALAKLLGLSRSATAQLCAEGSVTIDSQELLSLIHISEPTRPY